MPLAGAGRIRGQPWPHALGAGGLRGAERRSLAGALGGRAVWRGAGHFRPVGSEGFLLVSRTAPLVEPERSEREGYVPNVVYSCGAMRQGERIILPYAISDTFSTFATIRIAMLVDILKAGLLG